MQAVPVQVRLVGPITTTCWLLMRSGVAECDMTNEGILLKFSCPRSGKGPPLISDLKGFGQRSPCSQTTCSFNLCNVSHKMSHFFWKVDHYQNLVSRAPRRTPLPHVHHWKQPWMNQSVQNNPHLFDKATGFMKLAVFCIAEISMVSGWQLLLFLPVSQIPSRLFSASLSCRTKRPFGVSVDVDAVLIWVQMWPRHCMRLSVDLDRPSIRLTNAGIKLQIFCSCFHSFFLWLPFAPEWMSWTLLLLSRKKMDDRAKLVAFLSSCREAPTTIREFWLTGCFDFWEQHRILLGFSTG